MATRTKVIMFTDCVGSSTTKSKIGDAPSIEMLRMLERFTKDVAVENGGKIIKSLGDGHLLTFDSAVGAIGAGLDLQKKISDYGAAHKLQCPLHVRIGIDAGDVHMDAEGDVKGHFVDMAKRVESAGAGLKSPVLFSERVCALLPPKTVEWQKLRSAKLKGSLKPIALFQATSIKTHRVLPRQRLSAYLTGGFFQVLVPNFSLKKGRNNGLSLRIHVDRNLEVVTTGAQKQNFFREIAKDLPARDKLAAELGEFREKGVARVFDCRKWPFRYANGGALPVVRLNGVHYVCLFYRDIFPVGWNIANGASDSYAELYFPDRIIKREFGEELIVVDHDREIIKFFDPGPENISPGYQTAVIGALDKQFPAFRYAKYGRQNFEVQWLRGPDTVTISSGEDSTETDGVFVSITPPDNGIEIDHIAYVALEGDDCLMDGEVADGTPLGRLVGLFRLEGLETRLKADTFKLERPKTEDRRRPETRLEADTFKPDLYFIEGQPGDLNHFDEVVQRSIRELQRLRRPDQREYYQNLVEKEEHYDLCPVTDVLLRRFMESLKTGAVKLPAGGR